MKVFIIAEAGVNHNGSLSNAIEMIQVAKEAKADAIKFQTAVPDLVMTSYAQKANYQIQESEKKETQLDMIKKIHLPQNDYRKLKDECDKAGIEFMSTAFDEVSLETLEKLELKRIKIPSGEITNLPYLRKVGCTGKPIIMSTGMSNLEEISKAMDILFIAGANKNDITVLHCNTEYPTPFRDVNLQAMLSIRDEFDVNIGYSDHTLGIEVSIAAVAMGATVIEKHFTLNRKSQGPDHAASLEPEELKSMILAIRNIQKAFGDAIKKPSPSEIKNISIARKSIVASKSIKKGEKFCEDNLTVKRPGTGISPMMWDEVLGKVSPKNFNYDELISL